jgi:hypothetical protein
VTAIELLEQHDARELVGQREGTERHTVVDTVELEPVGTPDHEADVAAGLAPLLEEAGEALAVERRAVAGEEADECPLGDAPADVLVLSDLDQLQPRVTGDELLVVLHVVGIRRSQAADGEDDEPHPCDTSRVSEQDRGQERHINIHFSPDEMAGHYANFANVSHSDYEFTITFARVDHEVEDEEIPGVVVSRINLSPRFMQELIDAMQDNYSKWRTREGIKNLPEFEGTDDVES